MVEKLIEVLSIILDFIVGTFETITPIFWNTTDSQFTFVGVFCVIGFGIGLCLLLINKVIDAVKLRS